MLKSSSCDYSDTYIFPNGTMAVSGAGATNASRQMDKINKQAIFKNCVPFTDCLIEINITQVDN